MNCKNRNSIFVTTSYDSFNKFPKIDAHSHAFFGNSIDTKCWFDYLKKFNIKCTHLMSCSWYNNNIEELQNACKKYNNIEVSFKWWCSIDYTHINSKNFIKNSINYLHKCKENGAIGVGEFIDKGNGDETAVPVSGKGIHINDKRLYKFFEECGKLKMPVAVHVGDPIWCYLHPEDNDGYPNSERWRIDTHNIECGFDELQNQFEEVVKAHPNTIFIGCHFLNLTYDIPRLSKLLDTYSNLYVDCSARMAEIDQTIYSAKEFFNKYQDRIIFGFDMRAHKTVWPGVIRILEGVEEHFYEPSFGYEWAYTGLGLSDNILKKIYSENIDRIINDYDNCLK